MNHELIERYIYAVTRRLPAKLRGDVEKELASLISDMLEARCGDVIPQEKDIRIVLTELGAPSKLAAKYSGDEGKALISGEYFPMYKFLLTLVLPIAAGGIVLANLIAMFTVWDPAANLWVTVAKTLGQIFAGIIGGSVQAFAIITFIFAVFEWKKVKLSDGDFIDSLPLVPEKNERIKPGEPIGGMVMCVLMVLAFLAFPQIMGGWLDGAGWVPALDVGVMRAAWLPIVLWAVLDLGKQIARLLEGRYTKRLAIVSAAANPVIAICAFLAFRSDKIMNPVFMERMSQIFGEEGHIAMLVMENAHLIFLGVVLFALVLDTVTLALKARKYTR